MLRPPVSFVLALAVPLLACAASNRAAMTGTGAESRSTFDRKLIRSGNLSLAVHSPEEAAPQVQRIVEEAGGFVEHSTIVEDANITFQCRIPAAKLDEVMNAVAALGKVTRRSLSERDVSDQYVDLEARLRNDIALRDRLQQLLARATSVKDVLAIEKELTRIQSEIETMQSQLDRLKSEVELSPLSIELEQKQILGPLGYLLHGLGWGIEKLFVIR